MSDISTFCPNNMNETRISQALLNAENAPGQISNIDTRLTEVENWKRDTADPGLGQLSTNVYALSTSLSNLATRLDNTDSDIYSLLDQIIWRGSINALSLEGTTFTYSSATGFTARIRNGIIMARKSEVTTTAVTMTIEGIAMLAGEYYVAIGGNLQSTEQIYTMQLYDDNNTLIGTYTNTDEEYPMLVRTEEITNGKIILTLNKTVVNTDIKTVPMFSITSEFDKNHIIPYFKPLVEVSGSE